jgi:hypothetical protein
MGKIVKPYFPHDSDLRKNKKVQRLCRLVSPDGKQAELAAYARFLILLEILRDSDSYSIELRDEIDREDLAIELKCESDEELSAILDTLQKCKLIVRERECIYANGLFERMEIMDAASVKRSDRAKRGADARWKKEKPDATSEDEESLSNAQAMLTDAQASTSNAKSCDPMLMNESMNELIKKREKLPAAGEGDSITTVNKTNVALGQVIKHKDRTYVIPKFWENFPRRDCDRWYEAGYIPDFMKLPDGTYRKFLPYDFDDPEKESPERIAFFKAFEERRKNLPPVTPGLKFDKKLLDRNLHPGDPSMV